MARVTDTMLGIRKAAVLLALDNGMINRQQTEEMFLDGVERVLSADGIDHADLLRIDVWLQSLSEEDLETLCAGEHSDILELLAASKDQSPVGPDGVPLPSAVNGLLNDIFEYDGYDKLPWVT